MSASDEKIITVATTILLASEGELRLGNASPLVRLAHSLYRAKDVERILLENAEDEYWARFVMTMLEGGGWIIDEKAGREGFARAEALAAKLGGVLEFSNPKGDERAGGGLTVSFAPRPEARGDADGITEP